LRQQLTEIEKEASDPNLWSNPERSQQVMREKKRIEEALATDQELTRRADDIGAYFELIREGESVNGDLQREITGLQSLVDRLETNTLLSGDNDALIAIVTIHAGAGGVDSQDWADMLLRMYLRWAERQAFKPCSTTTNQPKRPGLNPRLSV
jgi:peptide chain release factor 2